MRQDFLSDFSWHSSLGISGALKKSKYVKKLANTAAIRGMFFAAGNNLLIHKTTKCLWRVSKNGKSIEPVFASDVLTEDDVKEAMSEG